MLNWEKDVIKKMVALYCHQNKHSRPTSAHLCPDCDDLLKYALKRLDRCQFGHQKPTCEKCPIHCYHPARREQIKKVMRYAGPRMILKHPLDAVKHLLKNRKKL